MPKLNVANRRNSLVLWYELFCHNDCIQNAMIKQPFTLLWAYLNQYEIELIFTVIFHLDAFFDIRKISGIGFIDR